METDSTSVPVDRDAAMSGRPFGAGARGAVILALLVPLAAGGVAVVVSRLSPLMGPLLVGLLLGVAAINVPRLSTLVTAATSAAMNRRLLRLGVVLLGLKVVASDLLHVGWLGAAVITTTVIVTFTSTMMFGRLLGIPKELTTLIAAGFSICGAAAIAATETTIRARAKDVALAVGLVTLFGTAMIAVLPMLTRLLHLSSEQGALWAGASIHEVAQVIAAASLLGGGAAAVSVATTIKLGRVVMLAPVQLVVGRASRRSDTTAGGAGNAPMVPMFVIGFLAMVAVRGTGALPDAGVAAASLMTTLLLAAAMFGLGTAIRWRELWPIPPKVLVLAGLSTTVAAGVPLTLIVTVP